MRRLAAAEQSEFETSRRCLRAERERDEAHTALRERKWSCKNSKLHEPSSSSSSSSSSSDQSKKVPNGDSTNRDDAALRQRLAKMEETIVKMSTAIDDWRARFQRLTIENDRLQSNKRSGRAVGLSSDPQGTALCATTPAQPSAAAAAAAPPPPPHPQQQSPFASEANSFVDSVPALGGFGMEWVSVPSQGHR